MQYLSLRIPRRIVTTPRIENSQTGFTNSLDTIQQIDLTLFHGHYLSLRLKLLAPLFFPTPKPIDKFRRHTKINEGNSMDAIFKISDTYIKYICANLNFIVQ